MILIASKNDGFRRCGVAHPKQSTEYPNDRFTADELVQLKNEPMLVVQVTDGGGSGRPNVQASIALIQAATTIEELDKLATGEERKGVQDAIAKRRSELATKE